MHLGRLSRVEVPIPDKDTIINLQGAIILIKLALNIVQAGTNNAMTRVLVLSAKVNKNEQLWQTLDVGNMFEHKFS